VLRSGVEFDPAYGNSGGEDTDFFNRLASRGLQAVWCDEAEVYERIGSERMTAAWLLRRAFAGGLNHARIFRSAYSPLARIAWGMLRGVVGLLQLASTPVLLMRGYARAVRGAQSGLAQLGQCAGLCGPDIRLDMYGSR
jgi:succinoglycan biosynthesis protein ExoM